MKSAWHGMEYFVEMGYLGLFLASFLAATILPLSSELVLSALILSDLPTLTLVFIATVGNVLGSIVNYLLGYWAKTGVIERYLKVSEKTLASAQKRFLKYGLLSLCFSWVPIIGDPLTLVAGLMRVPISWFLLLVTTGKLLRYTLIASIVSTSG